MAFCPIGANGANGLHRTQERSEKEVTDFFQEQRKGGMPVMVEIMQAKAKEIANIRGVARTQSKASRGRVTHFMKRFGVSLRRRTSVCQTLPPDFEEKLVAFHTVSSRSGWKRSTDWARSVTPIRPQCF